MASEREVALREPFWREVVLGEWIAMVWKEWFAIV